MFGILTPKGPSSYYGMYFITSIECREFAVTAQFDVSGAAAESRKVKF